jgi:hypothetical protein
VEQSKIVAGGVIAGKVVGPDGEPIAGANVMFAGGPGHRDIALLTDAQGGFKLGAQASGTYRLLVNAPGFPLVNRDIEVTDQATTLIEIKVGGS